MRQIVFDTETTGFKPSEGHRMVEIGALEIEHYVPTGRTFHYYINPERDIPEEVVAIHGIDNEKVKDCPTIAEIIGDWIEFVGDADLVAHNAPFDIRFLNAEYAHCGLPNVTNTVIDTLEIARKKFPGAKNSLDALCQRYEIDNSGRTYHGALLDSELLVDVYIELMGGRQQGFALTSDASTGASGDRQSRTDTQEVEKKQWPARIFAISEAEAQAHQEMIEATLADGLWVK